jgi:hypothetical protein
LHSLFLSPELRSQLHLNYESKAKLTLEALVIVVRSNPLQIKVRNDPLEAWKKLLHSLILSSDFKPEGGGNVRFVAESGQGVQLAKAKGVTFAGHKIRVRIMLHNQKNENHNRTFQHSGATSALWIP